MTGGDVSQSMSFERSFGDVEAAATEAMRVVADLGKVLKTLKAAAAVGDLGALHRSIDDARGRVTSIQRAIVVATDQWPFDVAAEEQHLGHRYAEELADEARRAGLTISRLDNALVAYPSVIQLLPAQRALKIDGKRFTTVRPSHVTTLVGKRAKAKLRYPPSAFLELLFETYRRVVGPGEVGDGVALHEVYQALTPLPESRRDFTISEFAVHVLALDRSGVSTTKSGHVLSLPASTGTKGANKTLSVVDPGGRHHVYFALRFRQESPT